MLGLKLNHVSKRGPWSYQYRDSHYGYKFVSQPSQFSYGNPYIKLHHTLHILIDSLSLETGPCLPGFSYRHLGSLETTPINITVGMGELIVWKANSQNSWLSRVGRERMRGEGDEMVEDIDWYDNQQVKWNRDDFREKYAWQKIHLCFFMGNSSFFHRD